MHKIINQIEPGFTKQELNSVKMYLNSGGWITEHLETEKFENYLAKYVGCKFSVIFPNGTITMTAILSCLGIKKNDEVIVPGYTMIATPNSILMTGATPVFVDIETKYLCMCPKDLLKKINKKTKAVIYVTLNGRSGEIEEIKNICKKNKIYLIEDSAHSLGSFKNKKHHGTFGVASSISFSMPKIITTGQGGAVLTNDKNLFKKLKYYKDFGRKTPGVDIHNNIGFNFKVTDMQSALGIAKLKNIKKKIKKKKKILYYYKSFLKNNSKIKIFDFRKEETPWFIDIYVQNRNSLRTFLLKNKIKTRPVYPNIIRQKIYKKKFKLKFCDFFCNRGLWLPSSLTLTKSEILHISKTINKFYKN